MFDALTPHIPLILALLAAGAFAGVIAGLFGIGGGVVIVPTLAFAFAGLSYEAVAMHAAVGCSLATIVATSIRSGLSHHKRGAVDVGVVKTWTPWIMAGAVIGGVIAGYMPGDAMRAFFGAILVLVALQFIFGRPNFTLANEMPKGLSRAGLAGGLGAMSGIMGIGGGVFGVTLMTLCGYNTHRAVGTAATFGFAIGLPAAITYGITGWGQSDLPPYSIGYLNIPAILIIGVMTTSLAPVGAALAHKLNANTLRRVFGIVLLLLSARMLYQALGV